MGKEKLLRNILTGTGLSVLIFFAVSFVQVLFQLPPVVDSRASMKIGLPFRYFFEGYPRGGYVHGWNPSNLIFDCFIIWLIVTGLYLLIIKKTN